jgi:hypothetical protein
MALTKELLFQIQGSCIFFASRINRVWTESNRHDEIVAIIESSDIEDLWLDEALVDEELRRCAHASVSTSRVKHIDFRSSEAIRDSMRWMARRETLVHMTSLESVGIRLSVDMSVQDCDALLSLLLTSTSLQKLHVRLRKRTRCDDDVMSTLARFLGSSS